MKPFATFPDPVLSTLRVIRGAIARDAALADSGLSAHHTMPLRTVDTLSPVVVIRDEGDDDAATFWPVAVAGRVTVTVWASDPALATTLAARLRAHLLAYSGDALVGTFLDRGRHAPSRDRDDGSPTAAFSVAARMCPTPAA